MLDSIARLKFGLSNIIEPDFGLLDELLSLGVLTRRDYDDVRSERRAAYRRSEALLNVVTSEDQCVKFLTALPSELVNNTLSTWSHRTEVRIRERIMS